MANPEHVKILKQGVEVWNQWRGEHVDVRPKLTGALLTNADLISADLSGTDLTGADLTGANLAGANLNRAELTGAHISYADLIRADLCYADLTYADLTCADLTDSKLSRADLWNAKLIFANLTRADFTNITLGSNTFAGNDLSEVKGLEAVRHSSPSDISIDTLNYSAGKIPEVFLRGCGFSDWQIEHTKLFRTELSNEEITNILYKVHDLRASQAIQISPLFISYTRTDSPFVDEIETHFNEKGVRFWRDTHHSTAGRLERQIDRAIRLNHTVLLILSEHSVRSDWVEHEARLARKLELESGRDVLCPVALDDSWKTCRWPERLREQIMEYNVLDFSDWRDEDHMRRMFSRLIEGLGLFYK